MGAKKKPKAAAPSAIGKPGLADDLMALRELVQRVRADEAKKLVDLFGK